jgi:hypothetical protein
MKYSCKYIGLLIFSISISSCKKKSEPAVGIDMQMFEMAKPTAGFTWNKYSSPFWNKSSGSGHNYSKLRTRYNEIASAMLDNDGKVKAGAVFPEGSFIVKELSNGDMAERYAMLLKSSGSAEADEKGWVWGYVNANGSVSVVAIEKGAQCKGCHNQDESIDYMLMNKFFP